MKSKFIQRTVKVSCNCLKCDYTGEIGSVTERRKIIKEKVIFESNKNECKDLEVGENFYIEGFGKVKITNSMISSCNDRVYYIEDEMDEESYKNINRIKEIVHFYRYVDNFTYDVLESYEIENNNNSVKDFTLGSQKNCELEEIHKLKEENSELKRKVIQANSVIMDNKIAKWIHSSITILLLIYFIATFSKWM